MPYMKMQHDVDPKKKIMDEVGDLDSIELFNDQVLVGVYLRPEKTKSGFYLTDNHRSEDRHQSKVGVLLKKGPWAFEPADGFFDGTENFQVGDWLVFRPSDGWQITVHGVLCRVLRDEQIKKRVQDPDEVW